MPGERERSSYPPCTRLAGYARRAPKIWCHPAVQATARHSSKGTHRADSVVPPTSTTTGVVGASQLAS